MSIRTHLLFRLIIASVLLVGVTTWLGYEDVREETWELFDAQLARSSRMILGLVQAQNVNYGFSRIQDYLDENGLAMMYLEFQDAIDELQTQDAHVYESKLAFQIWDQFGNLLVKSYNAPLEPLSNVKEGFNNIDIDGHSWRTFSLVSSSGQYRCITAERVDVRNDLIVKVSNDLLYLFIILVPLLSVILYISIDKGLRPLQQLAAQIDRRSGENLGLIRSDYRYSEIVTIKNALNQLLARLDDTLAREKRVTSDAAHELRTPLAAVRLHAELARGAAKREQQVESLEQVIHGVDRTTHLIEQLLALARLEPELLANEFADVDLAAVVVEECALLSPLAIERDIELDFIDSHKRHHINGHVDSLRLLVRNLLTNAISYTPRGGAVQVRLDEETDRVVLVVEDNGPGIAEADRQRVMERFYRVENHQVPGCGIGLSIVERVVEVHQGGLELAEADSGQGLKVIVSFKIRGR